MEVQREAPDEHMSKRSDGLTPAFASELESLFADVMRTPEPLQSSTDYLVDRPKDPIVWKLRLLVVEKLNSDFEKELDLVGLLAEVDTKNYWMYRRSIAKKIGTTASSKELDYTAKIISNDARNYQAWYHRQWTLKELEADKSLLNLAAELGYCDEILKNDVCNPFAWNQRLFVVMCTEEGLRVFKHSETVYTIDAILSEPDNECPWRHITHLHYVDMSELCCDYSDFYLDALRTEVFRAQVLSERDAVKFKVDPDLSVDILMNRRGCLHALNLVLEFLKRGYKPEPGGDLVKAIEFLYTKSDNTSFEDKVRSIIRSLDGEAKWRYLLDKSVDEERNTNSYWHMSYLVEFINHKASKTRTCPLE